MTDNRIHESDLYIPTLRLLNQQPDGFLTTSELIEKLEKLFNIQGEDAEILDGRSDTKFSQIVRNLISHKTSTGNIIYNEFAEYDEVKNGLRITSSGKSFLTKNGVA